MILTPECYVPETTWVSRQLGSDTLPFSARTTVLNGRVNYRWGGPKSLDYGFRLRGCQREEICTIAQDYERNLRGFHERQALASDPFDCRGHCLPAVVYRVALPEVAG